MDSFSAFSTCSSPQSINSDCTPFSEEDTFPNLASKCPKKRAGRKKFRETRHPVYRGVRRRNGGRWVCEVREPVKQSRVWLGTYPTAEMAARAHDVAAMAFRGRSACINFADSAWLLPIPDTGDPRDIQKAAAEAAEMFRLPVDEQKTAFSTQNEEVSKEDIPAEDERILPDCWLYLEEEAAFTMTGLPLAAPLCHEGGFHWADKEEPNDHISLWSFSV
ncbi:dehydration-responsive element-binding protein 1E-like [Aristolochia californica]|uniref:dehydration-responsive element-binding protein 1E-like n=1 Tax=Aristolochia californica TaxID=171875 RepID=UPI0035E26739